MDINIKSKQDHKRNHVLDLVGRNVMWELRPRPDLEVVCM